MSYTITRQFRKYTYSDSERGIEIVMKQLHTRNFEASAHVTVKAMDTYGTYHGLYKSRSGITTDTARTRIANRVVDKLLGDDKKNDAGMKGFFGMTSPVITNDWSATLNEACEEILETHYAGTPPVNLYDQDSEEDDVWRIPALLSEDTNIMYGHSGSGKSYLSIIFGQAIQHGVAVCGLRTIQGNVLILDYETTASKMRRRFKRVDNGLETDGIPMLYKAADVPVASMVDNLQEYIIENNVDFLIIDSLARACGGKITDEEGVGNFFEALRQLERPCLIVHHTNKSDEYYGSPFIRANARNLWRLRSVQNEGQQQLSIQLEQEKENDGPAMGILGFVLKFVGDPYDPDAVCLEPQDASMVPDLRKYASLTQRLAYHLEETPMHRMPVSTIDDVLGLSKSQRNTLRSYIWDLRNNAGKYKKLNELMHVSQQNGEDMLALNTERGKMPEIQQTDFDDMEWLEE